jgi:multimeric flavodoxin WrbA
VKGYGIVGSPKKNGNVDLLVSRVLEGIKSRGAETEKVYLNDSDVMPCQSCSTDPYPRYCFFDDDMKLIYAALESCDIIVLGSPVYFDTVSAQTKLMIDRCNCLMPYVEQPDGTYKFERRIKKQKKGVFIAVAGKDQEFETIQTTVNGFFKWANIQLIETILYPHEGEFGCVRKDKEKMAHAFDVGVRILKDVMNSSQ